MPNMHQNILVMWAGEMAQQVKVLVTRPNLSSIPSTRVVEGKNQLLKVALWLSHVCPCTHISTQINLISKKSIDNYFTEHTVFQIQLLN